MTEAVERYFIARVEVDDGCWRWRGTHLPTGYPCFAVGHQGRLGKGYAHHLAWEMCNGPIPAGHQIHHTCHNTGCVNPSHLQAVTPREHGLLDNNPIISRARQTHCIHGHPFTMENTYWRANGTRWCLACARERNQRYYQARQARKTDRRPERANMHLNLGHYALRSEYGAER